MVLDLKKLWFILFPIFVLVIFIPVLFPNFILIETFNSLISSLQIIFNLLFIIISFFVIFYPMFKYYSKEEEGFWAYAPTIVLMIVLYLGIRGLFIIGIL